LRLPLYLAGLGVLTAWLFFLKKPALADAAERSFKWLYAILVDKYGFDWFNEHVIMAAGARLLGGGLWKFGDEPDRRRRSSTAARAGRLAQSR
jgi:NADH-quinone oxidoreductase subunit L